MLAEKKTVSNKRLLRRFSFSHKVRERKKMCKLKVHSPLHGCTKYSKSNEYSKTKKIGHSTLEYSPDPFFFFSSIYSFWHSSTRTSGKKSRVLGRVLFFFPTFFHSFEYSSARTSKLKRRKKMGRASTRVSSGLFFSFPSTRYSSSTLYNHASRQCT